MLAQLGSSKLVVGGEGSKLDLLIGPVLETILPPSWVDGVKRRWVSGEELFPDAAAPLPDPVLCQLGCDLNCAPEQAESALLNTDSIPTSVESVVSVVSVPNTQDPTAQRSQHSPTLHS